MLGWVQNDEAAAHYIDIIGQYSLGASKLLNYFGKCTPPKIAWQVDPFGHSREHANIVALVQLFFNLFDNLFYCLVRI